LFGPLFNWTLYGVLCVQIYVYSYNFPNEKRPLKFLAYFVFLLETVQTALSGSDVYYWFIAGFGNAERLTHSHFGGIDAGFMTGLLSVIVQGYFCYRIWVLNNKRLSWMCWIIAVCTLTQSAAVTWLGAEARVAEKYVTSKIAIYLWSIPSALADILIAVAMTLQLRRATGNFTSFVLVRVVRLTVETNTLTAASVITILVLYAAFPNEVYYVYLAEIIGKLYSNTLLVSLNNRIYFREHQTPGHDNSTCLAVSDRVRTMTLSPLSCVVPEPQSRASNGVISHFILDCNKGDDASTDLSLVCVIYLIPAF
ncbi:hypothetical protein V8E53_014197, partial [Lactarius tabidus]